MKIFAYVFFGVFFGVCACGLPTNTECTDEAVAGIDVSVIDSSSGNPICDATIVITDGTYSETLHETSTDTSCSYSGAYERAGTYDLVASAPNKTNVTQTGIVVMAGACHVLPQSITIEM